MELCVYESCMTYCGRCGSEIRCIAADHGDVGIDIGICTRRIKAELWISY